MKKKSCTIIFNTCYGYCLAPIKCASIRAALRLAHENGLAFRILVNGECIKSGWYAK